MLKFNAPITLDAAAPDGAPKRTITGIAVPYGVAATVTDGTEVRFEKGALPTEGKAPKLFLYHDATQPVGLVTERVDTEEGMLFSARIASTAAGDEALTLAIEGVLDSVSVGVNPTKFKYDKDGVMVITAADWLELSMVPVPAFAGATITEVAAAAEEIPTETTTVAIVTEEATQEENEVSESPAVIEASSVAPVVFAQPKSRKMPTVGEYITKLKAGGHEWQQFNANLAEICAAQGDVFVSDAAGVVPTPILPPVYDDVNALRPITSALGVKAMPEAGATFIRPYIKVHSAVAEQSTELSNLTNADFEVDDKVVTKKTFGGRLYLSEQVIDWSSPSMLDQAIVDLSGQYALATEKYVVDQMAAAVTNTQEVVITDFTDEAEFIADLYTAAASIAATGNYLPNALVVSPTRWASLGSLVDGQGRAVFPQTAPMNGIGTLSGVTAWNGNPLGLQLVVSNQVGSQVVGQASGGGYTAKTASEYYWLVNTRGIEVYEQQKGLIRLENPDQLGLRIAFRGYFAAHVMDVNMIRILGPNATFA
jgi:HK97 family phage prohead protease